MRASLSLLSLTCALSGRLCFAQTPRPAEHPRPSAPAAEQEVPALKNGFEDLFLIGGALNRNVVTGRDAGGAAIAV